MDWYLVLDQLAHLAGAFGLAIPIGWERERASRSAGLRTFPLVAAASCAFVLIGRSFIAPGSDGEAHARLIEGLMTGIGSAAARSSRAGTACTAPPPPPASG